MLGLKRISTALGILAVSAGFASAQAPSANQTTANAVARSLKSSQALTGYRLDIESTNGQVTLSGRVASLAQKREALSLASRTAGVTQVMDQIQVVADSGVRAAQYQPTQVAGLFHGGHGGASMGLESAPAGPAYGPAMDAGAPVPEGAAGGATAVAAPGQPNYAWPSYAPGNNFSAVGYPTAYPWQAWPNIGPFYPYPEVPLDWRAVTLRWDDGIWWLDFKKHYTRPFFTPYPFGLFAY